MPPFPILLANRARLTQNAVHETIHEWLSGHGGFQNVRYRPSKIRRREVHADVDPKIVLGGDCTVSTARLEVQFEFPQNAPRDYYRIQWVEPGRNYSVGWHQDDHRSELGECHLQLDHGNKVADVQMADFLDVHPLNVLEDRLEQLSGVLAKISWSGGEPRFERRSD